MAKKMNDRRTFLQNLSVASFGLVTPSFIHTSGDTSAYQVSIPENLPNNPLVFFDNFHVGNRRSYSLKARMAAAQNAGFDGFEVVNIHPDSDEYKKWSDLFPRSHFSLWGFHWTSSAVIDQNADQLESDIETLYQIGEKLGKAENKPYISLSLSGTGELRGSTIHESGSAKAENRHWERAYQLIRQFDQVCAKFDLVGALYPHTHWICDTPQSQAKILDGSEVTTIGPAFCSHHWYANRAADELDEVLAYPMMKNLNYVVLTNGRFQGDHFPAVRFDLGEIDMAWILAKIYSIGYKGPISTQGWAIGGDPFIACKKFVEGIYAIRQRFKTNPELFPLVE